MPGKKLANTSKAPRLSWDKLLRRANQHFGIDSLRPGQREIIEAVLANRDVLGIMPTGAGKSLCFQLPALVLPNAVLVVSPLIALMEDQRSKAEEAELNVAKLDSTLSVVEEREAKDEVREGESHLIYVTPERLEKPEYIEILKRSGVSLFVIDEAHCLSQWGHDFRPAYLGLRDAIRELGRPPVLALTATATPEVADDILKQLDLGKALVVNTGINRGNLFFEVHRTVNADAKRARLLTSLKSQEGTAIVYVSTIRTADELCDYLQDSGVNTAKYHGQMKTSEREDAQTRFMNNEYKVMVATKAFGLGIDKADIRSVIHYTFPDSLESYYQEAGRAGRDDLPARATLLYQLEDKRVQTYFLGGKYPSKEESLKVFESLKALVGENNRGAVPVQQLHEVCDVPTKRLKVVIAQLDSAGIVRRSYRRVQMMRDFRSADELAAFLEEYAFRRSRDRERLEMMMRYAERTECRLLFLKQYFGETSDVACEHCDNCVAEKERPAHQRASRMPEPSLAAAVMGVSPEMKVPRAAKRGLRKTSSELQEKASVRHRTFGVGQIVESKGDKAVVEFKSAQTGSRVRRTVKSEFLKLNQAS